MKNQNRTLQDLFYSPLTPLVLLVAVYTLVAPWGEYPVNDDWVWSRFARRFAESGKFVVDHISYPSVFGQTLIAYPVIRLFGFSHLHLRILSMLLGGLGIWTIYRLLDIAAVDRRTSTLATTLLVANPLYLFFAVSFMTEIYSHVIALLGTLLWFRDRAIRDGASTRLDGLEPLVSAKAAILTGLIIGFTFWIRQWSALVYPALVLSTLYAGTREKSFARLRATGRSLALGSLAFGFVVLLYLTWARTTGNIPSGFGGMLAGMLKFDTGVWRLQSGIFPVYMTAFLFPLLLLIRWDRRDRLKLLCTGSVFLCVEILGILLIRRNGHTDFTVASWLHRKFPFLSNNLFNAGIGPITLPDVYQLDLPLRPKWPAATWEVILVGLLLLSVCWLPALVQAGRQLFQPAQDDLRTEVLLFGSLWCFSSLAASIQVFSVTVMDRYYFSSLLGLLLVVAVVVSDSRYQTRRDRLGSSAFSTRRYWVSDLIFCLALAPLLWFTVAGVHDYFRWNDVRWAHFHRLRAEGVSPSIIQGGYEMSGLYLYDRYLKAQPPENCIGDCGCNFGWFCQDASYVITMNPMPGYEIIGSTQPNYWLAAGPPVLLLRRQILIHPPAGPNRSR